MVTSFETGSSYNSSIWFGSLKPQGRHLTPSVSISRGEPTVPAPDDSCNVWVSALRWCAAVWVSRDCCALMHRCRRTIGVVQVRPGARSRVAASDCLREGDIALRVQEHSALVARQCPRHCYRTIKLRTNLLGQRHALTNTSSVRSFGMPMVALPATMVNATARNRRGE